MLTIREAIENYGLNPKDSGAMGKVVELEIKKVLNKKIEISKQGKADIKVKFNCEIKTGGGELGKELNKLIKGSSRVLYIPVVDIDGDIFNQIGYFLTKDKFLNVLKKCELLREKTTSKNTIIYSIQTFWNNSKNAPHGKKYYKLIELLEQECETDLTTWLEDNNRMGLD